MKRVLAVSVVVGLLLLYWPLYWPHVRNEFFVLLGSRDESGGWYGLWSGFGGSIPDFLILGSIGGYLLHRNCHVQRCWHVGRHHVEGTPFVTCRKHCPGITGPVTAQDVADAHRGRS